MSRYPIPFGTRTEIQRRNDYRQDELQRFVQMSLPLSVRILTVRVAMTNLDQQRPYTELQQDIEDACNTFNRYIIYFTNMFLDPDYVVHGGEVSEAKAHLTLAINRAEITLELFQNLNNVRRRLTYD